MLKEAYMPYFGFAVSNQERPWVAHSVCENCRRTLAKWAMGENVYLKCEILMLWQELWKHKTDCNFCFTNTVGFSSNNEQNIQYPDVSSVTKPVLYSPELPFPICGAPLSKSIMEDEMEEKTEDLQQSTTSDEYAYSGI